MEWNQYSRYGFSILSFHERNVNLTCIKTRNGFRLEGLGKNCQKGAFAVLDWVFNQFISTLILLYENKYKK